MLGMEKFITCQIYTISVKLSIQARLPKIGLLRKIIMTSGIKRPLAWLVNLRKHK